jgi:predicted O-methyltransferase YrrM
LAKAFDDVLHNRRSKEEGEWVGKIEALRNRLLESTEEISITDYGADSPDLDLTEQEMSRGRKVTRTIGEICRIAKPYKWDLLLFKLVRAFRPSVCLELGTSLGLSAAYQAAACELNQHGRVVTLEGAESLVAFARENFAELGIGWVDVVPGRFQDSLQDVLDRNAPIDFVFIDGHHDEKATLTYFRQILPHLSNGAVLVFDDISWSAGMKRAWRTIQEDGHLNVTVDLLTIGIGIYSKSEVERGKRFKVVI